MIIVIVSIALFTIYSLLMLLYTYGWHKQKEDIASSETNSRLSITVIIPARNEAQNIGACLSSIIENDFPKDKLEIILIDDFSTDDTARIGEALLANGLGKVLRLEDYLSKDERLNAYKKKALEIAINAAAGNWIVTTDADCIVPINWLNTLMSKPNSNNQIKFVAAPVSFTPADNKWGWLYYFQSLDFMTMQGVTAASAELNLGNMCNGANLAFEKKAFEEVGGYKGIDHIASGDDMLLMHKIQQHYPTGIAYVKSKEAIVHTPAQPSWSAFLNQRIRWSSKADKYDDKKLSLILLAIYLFNVNFLALLFAGFFNYHYWLWMFGTIFAKVSVELIFLIPVSKFYKKNKELKYFTLLQPLHILYIISAGFLGKFGSYQWKGRTVK
mgnify:CR=1 FL=1